MTANTGRPYSYPPPSDDRRRWWERWWGRWFARILDWFDSTVDGGRFR